MHSRTLPEGEYDLVIVGGGIYGAFAALSAARRGLRTALLEAVDFGHATSANSLRTVHGGLRYLQHLDLRRMRESSCERSTLMRLVPDLITPMPFLLPTFGHGVRGPETMRVALAINDAIAYDRNAHLERTARLPAGRVVGRSAARRMVGGLEIDGFNGGALWYDGFNEDPEGMVLRIVLNAIASGAAAINHAPVSRLVTHGGSVIGVEAKDAITGREFVVRARHVINAAGPWVDELLGDVPGSRCFNPSLAVNLIVERVPLDTAVGIPIARRGRDRDAMVNSGSKTLFILPWGRWSLVGTWHVTSDSHLSQDQEIRAAVAAMLEDLAPAGRAAGVALERVVGVLAGALPAHAAAAPRGEVELVKHPRLIDHARLGGPRGLTTVVGVKWTTARLVADRAVATAAAYLGARAARRAHAPLQALETLGARSIDRVTEDIMSPAAADSRRLAVSHAIRSQMALTLEDLVRRRTQLWLHDPGTDLLRKCAEDMARELDWPTDRLEREVALAQTTSKKTRRIG
jgi:glycerol-3-phosphate dehydrogenase